MFIDEETGRNWTPWIIAGVVFLVALATALLYLGHTLDPVLLKQLSTACKVVAAMSTLLLLVLFALGETIMDDYGYWAPTPLAWALMLVLGGIASVSFAAFVVFDMALV